MLHSLFLLPRVIPQLGHLPQLRVVEPDKVYDPAVPRAVLLRPGHVVAEGAGVARPEGVLPLHVDLDLAEGTLVAALQARHLGADSIMGSPNRGHLTATSPREVKSSIRKISPRNWIE